MKKIIALLTVCVLLCSVSGCGSDDKEQLTVAYFANFTHAQALYMKAQGILEETFPQKNVEWLRFNAGPSEIEALFAGKVDIGYIGPTPAICAYAKSEGDVVIIAGGTNGGSALIAAEGSGIEDVSDLEGKDVAIPEYSNTQHISLLKLLGDNGLKTVSEGGTVNVVQAANSNTLILLERGEVDAALVPEPWASIMVETLGAYRVVDFSLLEEETAATVVVVRRDYLLENPDVVEEFLRRHSMVTDYINENEEEAKSVIVEEIYNLTGKSYNDTVIDEAFGRIEYTAEVSMDSIMEFAQILKKIGYIGEVPSEDIVYSE